MAKRRGSVTVSLSEPEADPRPFGCVQFASPTTADMASRFNTFNEPHSNAHGKMTGIQPRFNSQNPWIQKHDGEAAWESMNRKRGFGKEEK